MRDFDRDIFQKTVSPYNKWAYIEGLASFLTFGDLINWASMLRFLSLVSLLRIGTD